MLRICLLFIVTFWSLVWQPAVFAEAVVEEEVYARIGETTLTQDLVDAAFAKIPERDRLVFIRDAEKVENMLRRVLLERALADQSRTAGFDQNPIVRGRMEIAADKELSRMWVDHLVELEPDADYEALAKEYYLLNRERFVTEATYDATHLLISTKSRDPSAALALAEELLEKVEHDPSHFDALVLEFSEDPSLGRNQGKFVGVTSGQMVEPFEKAVMELEEPGDISRPVKSAFGYHIIRLDSRSGPSQQTFEEVKARLVNMHRVDYKERLRSRIIGKVYSQPIEVTEGAVEKMLKRYFGEDLEKAPQFDQ